MLSIVRFFMLATLLAGCAQQKLKHLEQRVAALERADEATAISRASAWVPMSLEPRYLRESLAMDYFRDHLWLTSSAQHDFTLRVTGWKWLLRGETEEVGFGLYSYLLITKPPINDKQYGRYAAAIKAVAMLRYIDDLEEAGAQRGLLNATHIPVKNRPLPPFADLVDEGYDYDRAALLMSRLGRPVNSSGPFIVSTLAPLSQHASPEDYLFQDLSESPVGLVPAWVAAFQAQAAKEKFWEPDSIIEFALKLRGTIGEAALIMGEIPDIATKVEGWIIAVTKILLP